MMLFGEIISCYYTINSKSILINRGVPELQRVPFNEDFQYEKNDTTEFSGFEIFRM